MEPSVTGDRPDLVVDVVSAVADANGVDPTELEPRLNNVVDTDALGRIFSDRPNGVARPGGRIVFTLCGCEVTIDGDQSVEVRPEA